MKKISLLFIIALILSFSIFGCSKTKEQEAGISNQEVQTDENEVVQQEVQIDENEVVQQGVQIDENEIVQQDEQKINRITITATKESMADGWYDVKLSLNVNNGDVISLNAGSTFVDVNDLVEPYNEYGDFKISEDNYHFKYSFDQEGELEIGYKIKCVEDLNAGYINQDFAWIPAASLINIDLLRMQSEIEICFDVPEDMYLSVPWEEVEENVYVVKARDSRFDCMELQKGGTIAWGNFDKVETIETDYHKLDILYYGTEGSIISEMSKRSYLKFVDILKEDAAKLVMPKMTFVFFDDDTIVTRGEGMTGVQTERISEFDDFGTIKTIKQPSSINAGNGDFNTTNFNVGASHGRMAIHQINHAFYDYLPFWWMAEGYADYTLYAFTDVYGIEDESIKDNEFQSIYMDYKENIVDKGYDLPLCIANISMEEASEKYKIDLENSYDCIPEIGLQYYSNFEDVETYYYAYTKGALALYTIDKLCRKYTEDKTVDDYIKNLAIEWHKSPSGQDDIRKMVIDTLNDLVGVDTTDFFDRFIFDNEPLPLEIVDGELQLIWNE